MIGAVFLGGNNPYDFINSTRLFLYNLNIPECDLYLLYIRHPDILLELATLQKPLILGITPGLGLLKQAQGINSRVIGPITMCSLEPNTGIPEIDAFAKYFGKPFF